MTAPADILRAAATRLRDAPRDESDEALADWLILAGSDLWAFGPLHCDCGCDICDDDLWAHHVRAALTLARLVLT